MRSFKRSSEYIAGDAIATKLFRENSDLYLIMSDLSDSNPILPVVIIPLNRRRQQEQLHQEPTDTLVNPLWWLEEFLRQTGKAEEYSTVISATTEKIYPLVQQVLVGRNS